MKTKTLLSLLALIIGLLLALLPSVTLFEDGSWRIGTLIDGCLPFALCSL